MYLVERAAYRASDYDQTPQYYASDGEDGPSYVPVRGVRR